jgi:hypothetical protein
MLDVREQLLGHGLRELRGSGIFVYFDLIYCSQVPSARVELPDKYMIGIVFVDVIRPIDSLLLINKLQIDFLLIIEELIFET